MSIYYEGKKKLAMLMQWRESEEYQAICAHRRSECERLINIGEAFVQSLHDIDITIKNSAVKIEYAAGGDIHRGFYCPSPVLDIVVGNINRGRILKRVTATSRASHRFGFSGDNKLLYAEELCGGEVPSTEYLIEQRDVRYGITINADQELAAISEEILQNQKVIQYSYMNVYPDHDGYFCANLHVERFFYDEQGLKSSEKEEFEPFVNVFQKYRYDFERKDGYLSTYTFTDCSIKGEGVQSIESPKYIVRTKRKV